jgi:hypothetical protein
MEFLETFDFRPRASPVKGGVARYPATLMRSGESMARARTLGTNVSRLVTYEELVGCIDHHRCP